MKKTIVLIVLFLAVVSQSLAGDLIKIDLKGSSIKPFFEETNLKIHFFNDRFVIGTLTAEANFGHSIIEKDAFNGQEHYYLMWLGNDTDHAIARIKDQAEILLQADDHVIVKSAHPVGPVVHNGIVRINPNTKARPPRQFPDFNKLVLDSTIIEMLGQIDLTLYESNVQHLEDYGTRNAYTPEAVQAQNWIKTQFESYGYTVELMDFNMPQGDASDNVIATKTGTLYPDEYVILGGHYDSYSWGGQAPGADDNASGTCGVMEAARIMSQYDFDRTLIFCAWGGEEYGLYGSEAYASMAYNQGMNILGYLNMDMIGYRHPGDDIHTDIIAPSSAQPLVDFYTEVASMYVQDFGIFEGALSGGSSDHASFNNYGYMGIFPFEDTQNYSPYIHTPDDLIGPSLNSFEMAGKFMEAIISVATTLANYLAPPQNLVGIPGDGQVELSWDNMADIDNFNLYRDDVMIWSGTETSYIDTEVQNFETYSYYVTAVYTSTGDESNPSNSVEVTPLPPMALPFTDDFESGAPYWSLEQPWGLDDDIYHNGDFSLSESPGGNYGSDVDASATLYGFDLSNALDASVSFWTRYDLETNYDYMYFEVSTDGNTWTEIDMYNGTQNSWIEKEYDLADYLGESYVVLRFRFASDGYIEEQGMNIDDFELNVNEFVGFGDVSAESPELSIQVLNNDQVRVNFYLSQMSEATITITDLRGSRLKTIKGTFNKGLNTEIINVSGLSNGLYFVTLQTGHGNDIQKIILGH